MSNKKSLEDRFKAIQDHCREEHVAISLEFDPVADKWQAWEDTELLTDPCDGWEELIEALEVEFNL
jgi:hypothetical protein